MLDSLMLERINDRRKRSGFPDISEEIRTLEFAEMLGVGLLDTESVEIIEIDE